MVTDGITEAMDTLSNEFGIERLTEAERAGLLRETRYGAVRWIEQRLVRLWIESPACGRCDLLQQFRVRRSQTEFVGVADGQPACLLVED